jgi:hypothetical protein
VCKTKIRTKDKGYKQKTVANMVDINPVTSIITLNVNSLKDTNLKAGIVRVGQN